MCRSQLSIIFFALFGLPALALQIRTEKLPWAIVGQPYRAKIDTRLDDRCLTADVRFSLAGGSLPDGLALNLFGLEGTPREAGSFRFTIRAANQCIAVEKKVELFVTGKPVLAVSREELSFEYHTGQALPKPEIVLVSSSWPELPYTVSAAGADWLRAEPAAGLTPVRGSAFRGDDVRVRIQPEKLPPGTYRTTMTFSTWKGANSPQIAVTLKVVKSE